MLLKYFLIFLVFPYPIFLFFDYKNNKITINKIKTINLNSLNAKKENNKQKNKKPAINRSAIFKSIIKTYYFVSKMRFKPFLWVNCTLAYGTGDASSTGLLYGVAFTMFSIVKYSILNNLFFNRLSFHLLPYWDRKILKSKTKILIITIPLLLFFYIFLIVINYIKIIMLQRRKSNE
ncbi:DUF2953 domain-containing protein [Clostridium sp. DL1XJH146]